MHVPRNRTEMLLPRAGLPMVFVHTPKCAGSFVAAAFGRRFRRCITLRRKELRGHLTWQEYKARFAELGLSIADFVTFSTVRNPWAWHVSWYSYIRNDSGGRRSGHRIEHELFQTMSFADYVNTLEDPDLPRGPQGYLTRQISDWFVDETGEIAVDYVLRTEHMAQDFDVMRKSENLRVALPEKPLNVSNAHDFREFYNDATADIIRSRHARDISLFGYDFERSSEPW